jgi:hypothetical protein
MKKTDNVGNKFEINGNYYVYLSNEMLAKLEGCKLFFAGVGNNRRLAIVEKTKGGRYSVGMYMADTVPICLRWLLKLSDIRSAYLNHSRYRQ